MVNIITNFIFLIFSGATRMFSKKYPALYQIRHCNQSENYISVFRNVSYAFCLNSEDMSFITIKTLKSLKPKKVRNNFLGVSKNYAFYQTNINNYLMSKGMNISNCPSFLESFPDGGFDFCVCSFMKNIFLFGGWHNRVAKKSCLVYNYTQKFWSFIENMNKRRSAAACAVFEGKIIVSGGKEKLIDHLRSVEAYDHYENKWFYFPDMVEARVRHSLVTLGNKVFAISGYYKYSWEVFDRISCKFNLITNVPKFTGSIYSIEEGSCCVGDKVILVGIYTKNKTELIEYDTKNCVFHTEI